MRWRDWLQDRLDDLYFRLYGDKSEESFSPAGHALRERAKTLPSKIVVKGDDAATAARAARTGVEDSEALRSTPASPAQAATPPGPKRSAKARMKKRGRRARP